jgi:hypothetical protein
MRFPLIACLLASTALETMARPTAEAIMQALAKRQEVAADGEQIDTQEPDLPELEDPNENNNRMIGDLKQGATTPVGQSDRVCRGHKLTLHSARSSRLQQMQSGHLLRMGVRLSCNVVEVYRADWKM